MGTLFCPPVFSIFEFYARIYTSVLVSEYQSNLGTIQTSLGIADRTCKNCRLRCYIFHITCTLLLENKTVVLPDDFKVV